MCLFLLGLGAEKDTRDNNGITPLHWAESALFQGAANQLLKEGMEVDTRD